MSPALAKMSEWSVGRAVSLTWTVPLELIVKVRSRVQAEKSSVSRMLIDSGRTRPKPSANDCVRTVVTSPEVALARLPVPPKASDAVTRTLNRPPRSIDERL